jgi:glycosyltransferase involved in cell wall biosynthesis
MQTTVYVDNQRQIPQNADFPMLFDIRPVSELQEADILIATRFDTVSLTKRIPARKKFYFVQQFETCMAKYCGLTEENVLWSYAQEEYEIITIGEHLAAKLRELGRESTVVDVGMPRRLYPYVLRDKPSTPLRILMFHTTADYKGGLDNPEIAQRIREKLSGNVIINSFHRDLEKPDWADEHFRPQKTSDVAEVYAAHDMFVYGSHSEGFSLMPREAMACGTPVIVTDFPGKDQYCRSEENCLVAGFRDFGDIADKVARLAKDTALWKRLSANGETTASGYDWSKIARQYGRIILGVPI